MTTKKKHSFFTYYWCVDNEEEDVSVIRVYGVDKNNKNVCVIISDFLPYIYLELPVFINSNCLGKVQLIGDKIDGLLGKSRPIKKEFKMMHKLYGASLNDDGSRKLFPYLKCWFSSKQDIRKLSYQLKRRIPVVGVGTIFMKMHESDASEILQFTSSKDVPTAGWITFVGELIPKDQQITLCDYEFKVKSDNVVKCNRNIIGKPLIMAFDIEVNSTNVTAMPKSKNKGDKVFQVSCVFGREGDENYEPYLLTLGDPDQEVTGNEIKIRRFNTEADLIVGFTHLIREKNPNIISGFNILGFDIQYMIDRAKDALCIGDFDKMGFHKYNHAKEKTIKWSSSAYKNQEFQYLDAEGRLFVDLLPIVRRDFKLDNYKLKTIAEEVLKNSTKDPLSVKGIFKCYRIGIKKEKDGTYSRKARKAMGVVGKYCIVDSVLVLQLMSKMKTWTSLTEMACVCNVQCMTTYASGQQIKVYSQVYKFCYDNNIVVEKDGYVAAENERFMGAKVFDPIPGIYDRVLPFDFASLYPTTIIAYNIDYSTLVMDESIPDSKCHVMKWGDHLACDHDPKVIRKKTLTLYIDERKKVLKDLRAERDKKSNKLIKQSIVDKINKEKLELDPYIKERSQLTKQISKKPMCEERYCRFIKEPKGVIPTILQNLLDARKNTRTEIKNHVKEIEFSFFYNGKSENIKTELNIEDEIELHNQMEILWKKHKNDQDDIYKKYSGLANKLELEYLSDEDKIKVKDLTILNNVLDKRQWAYKISANSMYGAFGVRKGYLPCMMCAMATTYMGRTNIELVAKTIPEKFGGELVYGDTDSNYIHFPHLKTAEESWDHAEYVADEVSKLFPAPIRLEFECAIYWRFYILTKKRYMYTKCLRDGVVSKKIGKKGVLLSRRDTSVFIRNIYEELVTKIINREDRDEVLYYLLERFNKLCSNVSPVENTVIIDEWSNLKEKYGNFVVTKSVGDTANMTIVPFVNEKGKNMVQIGDYKTKALPHNVLTDNDYRRLKSDNKDEVDDELNKKEADSVAEYYHKCLPAQVQLAEKMKDRGQIVQSGSRLEYLITDINNHQAKQYDKIESIDYFIAHSSVLTVDFFYYLHIAINSIDEILNIAYQKNSGYKYNFKKDFVAEQYNFRYKVRRKVLNELKELFKPGNLVFKDLEKPKRKFSPKKKNVEV